MKKVVKVLMGIVIGLGVVFALELVGNVVFTKYALNHETAANFEERLPEEPSMIESISHSIEETAKEIREQYEDYDDSVPMGVIWENSLDRTVNQKVESLTNLSFEAHSESKPKQSEDSELKRDLSQDAWETCNSTLNRELLNGSKKQRIEIVSAKDGSVLKNLATTSEISKLFSDIKTDDWELIFNAPIAKQAKYEYVIYQELNLPSGKKMKEVGRYLTYADQDYVVFKQTFMSLGSPDLYLKVSKDTKSLLNKI